MKYFLYIKKCVPNLCTFVLKQYKIIFLIHWVIADAENNTMPENKILCLKLSAI